MANPKSLVFQLHQHWDVMESLVRVSRDYPEFDTEQAVRLILQVDPACSDPLAMLRSLSNADVLQVVPRSGDLMVNPIVLEFVRGLTHEHELGLSSVLAARVEAIRSATQNMNNALATGEMDLLRDSARQLGELFRQISLQLHQDRDAILDIAEQARSADSSLPLSRRYRRVLEAYDEYIEPMNQMLDSGPEGIFYAYLESADESLEVVFEHLSTQGALYSHRRQIKQVSYQAKELKRLGRTIAHQCADTLLPLREELRSHSNLAASISKLLGKVRKKGLRRAIPVAVGDQRLPACRQERYAKVSVGDEVLTILAEAQSFEPIAATFPEDEVSETFEIQARVDMGAVVSQLKQSLPVPQLMHWLVDNYGHLPDAMVLQLYHEVVRQDEWNASVHHAQISTELKGLRVYYHPHQLEAV